MNNKNPKLVLALLFSETCYLYPLYNSLMWGLGSRNSLASWKFFALAAVMALANVLLAKGRHRYITIAAANIALFALLALAAGLGGSGTDHLRFFQAPGGLCGLVFFLWLGFRAIYLSRRKDIDVYLHFDLSVVTVFLIITFCGMAQALQPGSLAWLLASLLLNAAALSMVQAGKEAGGLTAWPGLLLVTMIIVPFGLLIDGISSRLYAPARFFYDLASPAVSLLGRIFVFLIRLLYGPRSIREDSVSPLTFNAPLGGLETTPALSGFAIISKIFFWLAVFVLAAVSVSLLLYLIGRLAAWLLGRQAGEESAAESPVFRLDWRRLLLGVVRSLRELIVPWAPGKIDMPLAYRAMLRWGAIKRCPRRACETPFEYLRRLDKVFPGHQKELGEITGRYVEYKYSPRAGDPAIIDATHLKRSLRKLYRPRLPVLPVQSRGMTPRSETTTMMPPGGILGEGSK